MALGTVLLQPPRRVPPPAHLCGERGARPPAAPAPTSPFGPGPRAQVAGDHLVGWPPPPPGLLPEGRGRGTPAALVARSSRGAAAAAAGRRAARSSSPPPAPAYRPRCSAPAFPSGLGRQRTHSLRGRLQGYPQGGGWAGFGHWPPPPLGSHPLRPHRCDPSAAQRPLGSVPQSRRGSEVPGGKPSWEAHRRQGGGRPWLGLGARGARSGEVSARRGCGFGGSPAPRRPGRGAESRGCRQLRGARGAPGPMGGRDKRAAKPAEETD